MENFVRFVDWESRFFGFPVGRIELAADFSEQELNATLRESQCKYRLIEIMLQGNGADTLQMPDVLSVCCGRHYLLKKPVPVNVPQLDQHIKVYSSGICSKQLERLAVQSESLIRIKHDPELSPHYERLFLTWINYSVSGGLIDSIWTWKEGGKHLGLATIRKILSVNKTSGEKSFEGRIGMLAVDSSSRGRGIGKQLFEACDFWCSSLGIPAVSVITQKENKQAVSVCEKIGYTIISEVSIYHYWSPNWIYDTRCGWVHRSTVKVFAEKLT